ncbi:MAG: hypothetical protein AB8I08_39010 [Sandaracinaceae bacterium]
MGDGHLELVWSRVRGGPEGALLALMDAAEQDPVAAEGLMAAYSQMAERERGRLVETIIADGRAAGRPVGGTLALLLGAEPNPDLARAIARGLDATVARPEFDRGWCWGDKAAGGTLMVRHLHGAFVEALSVTWDGNQLHADGDRLSAFEESRVRQHHGVPPDAKPIRMEEAVDRIAGAVWRVRRGGGSLPSVLRGFAHVFGPPSPAAPNADCAMVDGPLPDGVE